MQKLLTTILLSCAFGFSFGQGTTCANAISLPCATSNFSGTTFGALNNAAAGNCGSNYGQWYQFTGDGTATTISTAGASSFDHTLEIYSGGCSSLTSIYCSSTSTSTTTVTNTRTFTTTSGTTYFVFISYNNAYAPSSEAYKGNFTISRSCPTPPCSPAFALANGSNNCPANEFYVNVNITNLGSATTVKIVNNGGRPTVTGINTTGVQTIGPFPGGTIVNFVVENEANSTCTANANVVTSTCNPCDYALPFCSDIVYTFPTSVDVADAHTGPDYGCLGTQPNPIWYYMKIKDPGDLNLRIKSSCGDVDYAAWGPFSATTCANSDLSTSGTFLYDTYGTQTVWRVDNFSAPSGKMIDCAYSTDAAEYLYIPAGVTGDFYMVMITNYANCAGEYTFSKVGGTGSTDCGIVLPVELTKFDVACHDGQPALTWETASERDNDYFTIERSTDASHFTPVGKVDGKGNSSTTSQYSWTDPDLNVGTTYYRLKQTDFNGDSKYHDIQAATCEQKGAVFVYPNPAQDFIKIKAEPRLIGSDYFIYDHMGKLALSGRITSENTSIDLDNLHEGIYLFKAGNTLKQTFRVVKAQ